MGDLTKKYYLKIYNDGVDSTMETKDGVTKLRYDDLVPVTSKDKTDIQYTSGKSTLAANLSLSGLFFANKVFQPGHILAELHITPGTVNNKACPLPSLATLKSLLLRKKVQLVLETTKDGTTTPYTLADNYYIHELTPLYENTIEQQKKVTHLYVRLSIFSMDNLMRQNPFSEAYLGKRLCNKIVDDTVGDFKLKTSSTQEYKLEAAVGTLQHLIYKSGDDVIPDEELIQPYLVQYNENFYDFVARVANRCGEFMYFEGGKLRLGLEPDKIKTSTDISNYSQITYRQVIDDPISVTNYASDSVKNDSADKTKEANIADTVKDYSDKEDYDGLDKSAYNVTQDDSKHTWPSGRRYNSELAADEFYMPLYRNQFSNGHLYELYDANAGKQVVSMFSKVLSQTSLLDTIQSYSQQLADDRIRADAAGDTLNEKGNNVIDQYAPPLNAVNFQDVKKNNAVPAYMAVPFAPANREKWITLKYYSDIRSNQEKTERQTICIDMGSNYADVRVGSIVTIDKGSQKHLVVGMEMAADDKWKRSYPDLGRLDSTRGNSLPVGIQKIYAIPANGTTFYPPVLAGSVFRHAQPQRAIVIDAGDPKRQGRVRVRYPWQPDVGNATDSTSRLGKIKQKIADKEKDTTYTTIVAKKPDNRTPKEKKKLKKILDEIFELNLELDVLAEGGTPWIRMISPMATQGGGMYFKPEKGDEVLVDYENGNIECPYVVGTLYSKNVLSPKEKRVIKSPNGHVIKWDDPDDGRKFLPGMLPAMKFLDTWGILSDKHKVEGWDAALGGITLTDAYGFYKISMSSHERKVAISSPLGDVKIDAFTGITISAPNGNVKIVGKNVEISANNKVTITSGKNIKKGFFGSLNFDGDKKASELGKDIASALVNIVDTTAGNFIDLSFIRSVLEVFFRPVNGTMEITSNSFLLLGAGGNSPAIPSSAYRQYKLEKKQLSVRSNAYQGLEYIAQMIYDLRSAYQCVANNIAKLYNNACEKIHALTFDHNGTAKHPFAPDPQVAGDPAANYITNWTADQFIEKCFTGDISGVTWNQNPNVDDATKTDVTNKMTEARDAVRRLWLYCFKIKDHQPFNSDLDSFYVSPSITKLLNDSFDNIMNGTIMDGIHWWDIMKKVSNRNADTKKYDYFMQSVTQDKHVDTSQDAGYSDGVKKFIRSMIYNILGDGNPALPANAGQHPVYPINETPFFKRPYRFVSIESINATNPSTEDAIIKNTNSAFENYINSLKLKDSSESDEAGKAFGISLGTNLVKGAVNNILDKLTLVDDWVVWNPDSKGKILMSDNSETVSLNHPDVGTVNLEAFPSHTVGKAKSAEVYFKKMFIKIGT